jgi:hypothetical protein
VGGEGDIARIPVRNQSLAATQSVTIQGTDSSVFHHSSGDEINQMDVLPVLVFVDGSSPAVSFSFNAEPQCALSRADALEGAFSVAVSRGAIPANAALRDGYLEINHDAGKRISLFATELPGDYTISAFPTGNDLATLWSWLDEGCNSLAVHAADDQCNEMLSTELALVKDTEAPVLTLENHPVIYGPANYLLLKDSLNISAAVGSGCVAPAGTMKIWYESDPDTLDRPLDVAGYPASDSAALALWSWLVQLSGIPASANGETYLLHVRVEDCAGNAHDTTFSMQIDLTYPANTFTAFDARPTHRGVWLSWAWTAHTGPDQAQAMEVWRSPELAGDYPLYPPPNPQRWMNPADSVNFPRQHPPAGWIRVVHQTASEGTTSLNYTGLNGQGVADHAGTDSSYWLDSDSSWSDPGGHRNIYRYVTFVEDQSGNWSQNAACVIGQNADRSTNYWLGDFIPMDTAGTPASEGRVNSEDLAALSAHYFTTTDPAWGYLDIGPEFRENRMGKGIPRPDGSIDFFDLLPFSDNYGQVAPVGTAGEYRMPTAVFVETPRIDDGQNSRIVVSSLTTRAINVGEEFEVQLTLRPGAKRGIRIAEAEVRFDADVLTVLQANPMDAGQLDGIPFVKADQIAGRPGTVGVVAATIDDSAGVPAGSVLATVRFQWKNRHVGETRIEVSDVRLAEQGGSVILSGGNSLVMTARGVIPLAYALYQNYPNPFNPNTVIRFDLPESGPVQLGIYNLLGQQVRVLVQTVMPEGQHALIWDGRDDAGSVVGTGVYYYRLSAGRFTDLKKMLLVK